MFAFFLADAELQESVRIRGAQKRPVEARVRYQPISVLSFCDALEPFFRVPKIENL
jgi:hypothetical protein